MFIYGIIERMEMQTKEWNNIYTIYTLHKQLDPKNKYFLQIIFKKKVIPFENKQKSTGWTEMWKGAKLH